jgi:hypothetical protein
MKTNLSWRLALCGAVAFLTHTTSGQTWQTVDDYQLLPGNECAVRAMGKDPLGNLYAAGYAAIDANYDNAAVIKKSSDGGATWSVIDAFVYPATAPYCEYLAFTSDAAGTLYAAGDYWDNDVTDEHWFVRRSLDDGMNWTTVDVITGAFPEEANAVATDSAGNVYVAGRVTTAADTLHPSWIVRKSADHGTSWSTVDTFNPGAGASAWGVLCHPTAGIFVAGYGTATRGTGRRITTQGYWYVRRSQDGGATWTTVDAYAGGSASGIGADASGNIHVVGNNSGHWIVRKSANGGASWATEDDFVLCVTTTSSSKPYKTQTLCSVTYAHGFGSDSNGNLFVVGYGRSSSSNDEPWVVRRQTAGTATWQTVDTFDYPGGHVATALSVVGDNSGHVFVGGWGYDTTDAYGAYHWLVRKFPAP